MSLLYEPAHILKNSAAFGAAGLLGKAQLAGREFLIRDAYAMTNEPGGDAFRAGLCMCAAVIAALRENRAAMHYEK